MTVQGVVWVVLQGIFWLIVAALFIYFIYHSRKQKKKEAQVFEEWVRENSLTFLESPDKAVVSLSSFRDGVLLRGFEGVLPRSGNSANLVLQKEERGSGKSRRVYNRTIISITIPDTRLQMVINSKINYDAGSGGNLKAFSGKHHYTLEGDFGQFFDIFMPATTQSETLSILTPDVMLYIMTELQDFDIEINGPKLYLYTYNHLKKPSDFTEIWQKLDKLLEETRLRKGDTRKDVQTNSLVARTAVGSGHTHRTLKRDFQYLSILLFAAFFVTRFFDHPIALAGFLLAIIFVIGETLFDTAREARLKHKYNKIVKHYK